jgi:hypothetical protein
MGYYGSRYDCTLDTYTLAEEQCRDSACLQSYSQDLNRASSSHEPVPRAAKNQKRRNIKMHDVKEQGKYIFLFMCYHDIVPYQY